MTYHEYVIAPCPQATFPEQGHISPRIGRTSPGPPPEVDATAKVIITEKEILVRFQKPAHNPLLIAAGFDKIDMPIPWLGGKRLQLIIG